MHKGATLYHQKGQSGMFGCLLKLGPRALARCLMHDLRSHAGLSALSSVIRMPVQNIASGQHVSNHSGRKCKQFISGCNRCQNKGRSMDGNRLQTQHDVDVQTQHAWQKRFTCMSADGCEGMSAAAGCMLCRSQSRSHRGWSACQVRNQLDDVDTGQAGVSAMLLCVNSEASAVRPEYEQNHSSNEPLHAQHAPSSTIYSDCSHSCAAHVPYSVIQSDQSSARRAEVLNRMICDQESFMGTFGMYA